MNKYEVRVTEIIRDYYHIEAKDEDEAKELINETIYGRGVYGKKVDTHKHPFPKVDYAVHLSPEGEVILWATITKFGLSLGVIIGWK